MCGQCSLENQLMIRLLVITLVCSGHDHLEYHDHHVRDDKDDLIMVTMMATMRKWEAVHERHWQLIRSKLGFYFSSGILLDIDVNFLWRSSY